MKRVKETLIHVADWFQSVDWKQIFTIVGGIIFAAALVWGGIYLVSLFGYMSGT